MRVPLRRCPAPAATRAIASPARADEAVLPTELLTWPGCLLDFHAVPPPAGSWLAPPPRLMLPVLMLVLRLMLMLASPP